MKGRRRVVYHRVALRAGTVLKLTGTGGDGLASYGYETGTGLEAMGMGRDRVEHLSKCSFFLYWTHITHTQTNDSSASSVDLDRKLHVT